MADRFNERYSICIFFEQAGGELRVTSMIFFFALLHSITVWLPTRVICCFNFVKVNGPGSSLRLWFTLTLFRITVGWLGGNQPTSYGLAPGRLTVGNMRYQNMNQSYYLSYIVALWNTGFARYRLNLIRESLCPSCPRSDDDRRIPCSL